MSEILYFDACCHIGRHVRMPVGQPTDVVDTLGVMDHFGIHDALVVDVLSREGNPMAGNDRVLEITRGRPRLHPAWAGLMPQSLEMPAPAELVARMRENGVGALFLFYGHFDIRLDDWGVDSLLEPLAEARVPLFLCPDNWRSGGGMDATDWSGVVRICRRFPDLPVVVTESRIYRSQRAVYAAMAACPNLILELSSLWLHRRIEFICGEFGADRLVWGSQLPQRNPGVPLMQLNYSEIPGDELRLIAGGNMLRLLSWNAPLVAGGAGMTWPPAVDPLHQAARTRASLRDQRFYDCHGHIGQCSPHHVVEDTPTDLVREMDRFGVRSCCVFSLEGVFSDEAYGNQVVADAVKQHPTRFVGFTLVNPNHGEEVMLRELECGLQRGMQGVKLITQYHQYPAEGPLVDVACEFANRHGQLILSHDWGSPAQIERLCRAYPQACFIAGHSAGGYAEVTRAVGNLYICTCPFLQWGMTESYVGLYGAERIMFGSDLTDLPIAWGLAPIFYARIPEADKRLILGGNLKRVLDERGVHTG